MVKSAPATWDIGVSDPLYPRDGRDPKVFICYRGNFLNQARGQKYVLRNLWPKFDLIVTANIRMGRAFVRLRSSQHWTTEVLRIDAGRRVVMGAGEGNFHPGVSVGVASGQQLVGGDGGRYAAPFEIEGEGLELLVKGFGAAPVDPARQQGCGLGERLRR